MTRLGEGVKGLMNPSRSCHKMSEVTTRMRGTDMVTDISAERIFGVTTFRVNPGNGLLFPRLSAPSRVFEKYRFRKLRFLYRPISAATRSGAVVLEMETDVYDTIPTTKEEMLNHQNSARGLPWDAFQLDVAPKDLHPRPQMFIRSEGFAPSDYDARLDDLGELHLGVSVDSDDPIVIGELWVEYDVDFISPAVHSTEATARSFQLTAPAGTYANDAALINAMTESRASSMEEIVSVLLPDAHGGALLGLGPAEALVRTYARHAPGSTMATLPGYTASNGVTLRNDSAAGDFQFNNPGLFSYGENVASLPGLSFPRDLPADLAVLPFLGWTIPVLTAGTYLGGFLSLTPVKSAISAGPFPPLSLLKKQQLQNAWHRKFSSGQFHMNGSDCLVSLGPKKYFSGRGCVTSDWVLVKSPQDHADDERHPEPGPKRCEGACNSVQKFTFK